VRPVAPTLLRGAGATRPRRGNAGRIRSFPVKPMRQIPWLVLAGALLGCGGNPTPPLQMPPPFRPVADVKQLMATVVEPAAEVYWDAVGTIIDRKGIVDIAPKTVEEWEAVRNSAYVVAESGNLLMMAGRARDNGDWMKLSQALVDVGRRAIQAAESKNTAAVFDVGADVYDACTNCHARYALELMRPSAVVP